MDAVGINLFLGIVGLCTIIGAIGCDNFEALIIETIEEELIEPEDNEWIGAWALESYQGLSLLETLPEYDDYMVRLWMVFF